MEAKQQEFTYNDKRHCMLPGCSKPIPDQINKNRFFCEPRVLPDGSIENHKDDYHSMLRQVPKLDVTVCLISTKDDEKEIELTDVIVRKKGNLLMLNIEVPIEIDSDDAIVVFFDNYL